MMEDLLAVYQHPALTVMIDDSQRFLDSLTFQMDQSLGRRVFDDPARALAWLTDAYHSAGESAGRARPFAVDYDEQRLSFERRVVVLDIDQIYRMVCDRQRFLLPAVLVVDYAMPAMTGVEFFQAVRALPCKKILFTGQADDLTAINAFNHGLIDRFLKKGDADVLDLLDSTIASLRKAYFRDQSRTLADLLGRHSHQFLSDPAMTVLVEQLCQRYGFVEHYLFPDPEGLLLLDLHGHPTLLVIETAAGMQAHLEAARDHCAPEALCSALAERRLIPFFADTGMYAPAIAHDWLAYCLPAQHHQGQHDYYWALFDLPPGFLPAPIYSYAEFLRDQADRPSPG